jgi:hypothetical protein
MTLQFAGIIIIMWIRPFSMVQQYIQNNYLRQWDLKLQEYKEIIIYSKPRIYRTRWDQRFLSVICEICYMCKPDFVPFYTC